MKFISTLLFAVAVTAQAGTVTSATTSISFGFSSASSATPTTTNGLAIFGNYVGSGTACLAGFCPGEAVPGAAPWVTTDPLTFGIRNVGIQCNPIIGFPALPFCGNSFMGASVDLAMAAAGPFNVTLQFSGLITQIPGSPASASVSANACSAQCVSSPNTPLAFDGTGVMLPGSIDLGVLNWNNTLQAQISFTFGNSQNVFPELSLVFTPDGPGRTGVPEPATLSVVSAGLLAILTLARRRR